MGAVEAKKCSVFSEFSLAVYEEPLDEHSGNGTKLDNFVSTRKEERVGVLYKGADLLGKKARNAEELMKEGDYMCLGAWMNQLQELEESILLEDAARADEALKLGTNRAAARSLKIGGWEDAIEAGGF